MTTTGSASTVGRLAGLVAVVTGAGSGIGRESALLFGAEGAAVALVDRDGTQLAAIQGDLNARGVETLSLEGDVADEPTVTAHAHAILARFGTIDVLLAAAVEALHPLRPLRELAAEFGVQEATLRQWVSRSQLVAVRRGRRLYSHPLLLLRDNRGTE